MSLTVQWQYPEGYLDHVIMTNEDPPNVYGSTRGEHGHESARVIMSYLPSIYVEDPYLRDLYWAMGIELDAVRAALDTVLGALYVDFTEEWGLRLWERFAGLLEAPGGLTEAQRRATVRFSLGAGPVTVEEFREQVAEFVDVPVGLVEINEDYASYAVEIIVQAGLNADQVAALEYGVRRFLPAHLDVSFVYGGFIVGVNIVGDTI